MRRILTFNGIELFPVPDHQMAAVIARARGEGDVWFVPGRRIWTTGQLIALARKRGVIVTLLIKTRKSTVRHLLN